MDSADRGAVQVRNAILWTSGIAWAALLIWPEASYRCEVMTSGRMSWHDAIKLYAGAGPLVSRGVGWFLMVAAMMAPTLILPIDHVRVQSLRRRRIRSILLFLASYCGIWLVAGVAAMIGLLLVASFIPAVDLALSVGVVALIWQSSPFKQLCLNFGHQHPPLAAFGHKADRAAFRFGLNHGVACFGSCWAAMLLPMSLARGEIVAMVVVSLLIFSERLEQRASPRWRWRISDKLLRISIEQARIRMNSLRHHRQAAPN